MEEIGKVLPAVFRRHLRSADPRVVEILTSFWPRVAGKPLAQHCRPVAFWAGTLTLATACPSWATQLRQMAEEIRAEVNSFLGESVVKRLRVRRVARLEPIELSRPPQNTPAIPETGSLDWADAAGKLDPELSRVLERSFTKYFARDGRTVH